VLKLLAAVKFIHTVATRWDKILVDQTCAKNI